MIARTDQQCETHNGPAAPVCSQAIATKMEPAGSVPLLCVETPGCLLRSAHARALPCACHPLSARHLCGSPAALQLQLAEQLRAVDLCGAHMDPNHRRRRHRAGCAGLGGSQQQRRARPGLRPPAVVPRHGRRAERRCLLPGCGLRKPKLSAPLATPNTHRSALPCLAARCRPADLWLQDHAHPGREDVPPLALARCGGSARAGCPAAVLCLLSGHSQALPCLLSGFLQAGVVAGAALPAARTLLTPPFRSSAPCPLPCCRIRGRDQLRHDCVPGLPL